MQVLIAVMTVAGGAITYMQYRGNLVEISVSPELSFVAPESSNLRFTLHRVSEQFDLSDKKVSQFFLTITNQRNTIREMDMPSKWGLLVQSGEALEFVVLSAKNSEVTEIFSSGVSIDGSKVYFPKFDFNSKESIRAKISILSEKNETSTVKGFGLLPNGEIVTSEILPESSGFLSNLFHGSIAVNFVRLMLMLILAFIIVTLLLIAQTKFGGGDSGMLRRTAIARLKAAREGRSAREQKIIDFFSCLVLPQTDLSNRWGAFSPVSRIADRKFDLEEYAEYLYCLDKDMYQVKEGRILLSDEVVNLAKYLIENGGISTRPVFTPRS